MYKINHNKGPNILEIENSESEVSGKIHLDSRASLQELTLKGHAIIKDLSPLTYGWHPYFLSDNLFNSSLDFNSSKKIVLGERNITTGVEDFELNDVFNIEYKQLDDCWILDANEVIFNTPKYQLQIASSTDNNFLQAYTHLN